MTDTPKTPRQQAVEQAFWSAKRALNMATNKEREAVEAAAKHEHAMEMAILATRIAEASLRFCEEQYASAFGCSPPQDT